MSTFQQRKEHEVVSELNHNSSQALYAQLEEIIREAIENGNWLPGEAIPSERELSRIYQLSRMTVRRTIDALVTDGLLYRVDGKGTFVSDPKVSFQALTLDGLREQALQMGHASSASLLGIEKVLAQKKIAGVLKIAPETPVFLIERVHFVKDVPLAMHRSYIPCDVCPELQEDDLINTSLYGILKDKYGVSMTRARETLESTLASTRESLLLHVKSGSPMLLLRIAVFDSTDRPVEYVKVVFRGDKVQLHLNI